MSKKKSTKKAVRVCIERFARQKGYSDAGDMEATYKALGKRFPYHLVK